MSVHWQYEIIDQTHSTNTDLLNRWHARTLVEPTALLALSQTAGRGRRGNQWNSNAHESLTFSLAYPFPSSYTMMDLQGLTLACGVCLMNSLCQISGINPTVARALGLGLKWPNDLLLGERKMGGILVEGGQKDENAPLWMIIGIGLNLSLSPNTAPSFAHANLTDLHPAMQINLQDIWRQLCLDLGDMLDIFQAEGFVPFQPQWNAWHAWKNQLVSLKQEDRILINGACLGVNASGHLQIQSDNITQDITSGELTLRKFSHA